MRDDSHRLVERLRVAAALVRRAKPYSMEGDRHWTDDVASDIEAARFHIAHLDGELRQADKRIEALDPDFAEID